jgi:hypothetical protein
MQHIVGNLLTRATTLLETSSQSEVFTQSYGAPKSRESHLRNFETPIRESWDKMSFGCGLRAEAQSIL